MCINDLFSSFLYKVFSTLSSRKIPIFSFYTIIPEEKFARLYTEHRPVITLSGYPAKLDVRLDFCHLFLIHKKSKLATVRHSRYLRKDNFFILIFIIILSHYYDFDIRYTKFFCYELWAKKSWKITNYSLLLEKFARIYTT